MRGDLIHIGKTLRGMCASHWAQGGGVIDISIIGGEGGGVIDISIIGGERGGVLLIYQSLEPSNPNPCFAR